jgi:hypothetical protein
MTDKELLIQLNKFKNIKADENWKNRNRDVLLAQIAGRTDTGFAFEFSWARTIFTKIPWQILKTTAQPTIAVILISIFMLGSGTYSLYASRHTKPGDSLYIAKIISEKAQIAITFTESQKAKLGMQFASNRADEITQVLAETENPERNEKVESLVNKFNKEINTVRGRVEKMNPLATTAGKKNINNDGINQETGSQGGRESFFSANLGKDKNGVQIAEPSVTPPVEKKEAGDEKKITTSTPEATLKISTSTPEVSNNPQTILKEAGEL